MRRLGATVAVAMLLALTFAGPADAGKPTFDPPLVTSVTITETGGTWPYCEQTATLAYTTADHRPGYISISPYREGTDAMGPYYGARVRGSGTITFAITWDYSRDSEAATTPGWFWLVATNAIRTPPTGQSVTTTYDFKGVCPAPGTLLATGPEALPWP